MRCITTCDAVDSESCRSKKHRNCRLADWDAIRPQIAWPSKEAGLPGGSCMPLTLFGCRSKQNAPSSGFSTIVLSSAEMLQISSTTRSISLCHCDTRALPLHTQLSKLFTMIKFNSEDNLYLERLTSVQVSLTHWAPLSACQFFNIQMWDFMPNPPNPRNFATTFAGTPRVL